MNKKMKSAIAGAMVLGMTITGAAGVYAGSNLEKITAYLDHGTSIKVNGSVLDVKDANGKQLSPINYKNTEYLPVRALSEALNVPVTYDAKGHQVVIGKTAQTPTTIQLASVTYTAAQIKTINKEFAKFDGFTTPYAPKQMVKGDAFVNVAASGDSVNFVFKHMLVSISPRDDSYSYDGTSVTLSNGVTGKWYTPGDDAMLTYKLDDRFVTITSKDQSLSKTQIEKVAVSVAKLEK